MFHSYGDKPMYCYQTLAGLADNSTLDEEFVAIGDIYHTRKEAHNGDQANMGCSS
jgi:hypothetical protein